MKLNAILLAATLAAASFSALPAMAAELKIAVMDSQKVINEVNAAKRAVDTLKKQRDAAQDKINALEAPLVDKQKKLADQQKVLTPDKFAAAQADFQKEVTQFRTQAQTIQDDLEKQGFTLRKQITDAVKTVVDKMAKDKGYDLIIPKAMVFANSANVVDITADVLTQTNAVLDK